MSTIDLHSLCNASIRTKQWSSIFSLVSMKSKDKINYKAANFLNKNTKITVNLFVEGNIIFLQKHYSKHFIAIAHLSATTVTLIKFKSIFKKKILKIYLYSKIFPRQIINARFFFFYYESNKCVIKWKTFDSVGKKLFKRRCRAASGILNCWYIMSFFSLLREIYFFLYLSNIFYSYTIYI